MRLKCIQTLTGELNVTFDESRFTLSINMAANDVGDVKEGAMHQPVFTRRPFSGGGLTVWAGVSSLYRTALHFVNGRVTSLYRRRHPSVSGDDGVASCMRSCCISVGGCAGQSWSGSPCRI